MHVWRVSIINTILNFRKILTVNADSYVHAIDEAESKMRKYGYTKIEYCIIV